MSLRATILTAVLAFGAAAIAVQVISRIDAGANTAAPTGAPVAGAPAAKGSYAALIEGLDQRIAGMEERANGRPTDWLTRQHLAGQLLERAGLSGRIDDYDRVQKVLDDAFIIAVAGSGPLAVAARFNFSIHRLALAEEYLGKIERQAVPRAEDRVVVQMLRAQIALQRGQYAEALAGLTAVVRLEPAVGKAELALYHAKTGAPDQAEALLAEALAATPKVDPRRRAWILLQRGIVAMDRGDLRVAMEHLQAAEAELPGWWLVQEHIAEVHHRRSQHEQALAILEQLVGTTDLPQHMDALAGLYKHMGRPQDAEKWIAKASERWDQQLARYPESATGHALQHHLQFGTPERALELARANVELRPGGDAQVSLARALLQAGQPAEALAVVERTLATPYRTARLHDVAAKAYTAAGNTAAAEAQLALLIQVNPFYSPDDHSH